MSSSVEINVFYTLREKWDGKTVNKTLEKNYVYTASEGMCSLSENLPGLVGDFYPLIY